MNGIEIQEIKELIEENFRKYEDGDLLVAFGQLFTKNIKVYVYPALDKNQKEIITLDTIDLPQGIRFLFRFMIDQNLVEQIRGYKDRKSTRLNSSNVATSY